MYEKAAQRAQKLHPMYAKAKQHAQKTYPIYVKSVSIRKALSNVGKAASRIAQTDFFFNKKQIKTSCHTMKKKSPTKRFWFDEIKEFNCTHNPGRLNGKETASVTGRL